VARRTGRRSPAGAVSGAILALAAAGCAGSPHHAQPTGPIAEHVAAGRFTVQVSARAVHRAEEVGVDVPEVVARALDRVAALLPGPRTSVRVA